MRRLVLIALLAPFALSAGAARGDGCPEATCGGSTLSAAVPGSALMVFRPSGTGGSLIGYDVVRRRLRFSLGSGVLSADGRSFFTARAQLKRTALARYDARSGVRTAKWSIPGRFGLAAVSPSGRRLALVRLVASAGPMRVAVVDASRRGATRAAVLPATDQVEAVSSSGRRLFLVHALDPNDPLRYRLEVYDFATRTLSDNPPRDEHGPEKMTGIARNAVASRDGHWLLTVYSNPSKGYAFVHALDLRSGVAHCIDLDDGYDASGQYAVALSADDRTLYVAAPATGVLEVVSLRTLRVAHVSHFGRAPSSVLYGIGPNAAVSPLAGSLAFTFGRYVWRMRGGHVGRARRLGGPVAGVAFTPGGRKLVALVGRSLVEVRS